MGVLRASSVAADLPPDLSPELWGEDWFQELSEHGVAPSCEEVEDKILSGIVPVAIDLDGALRTLNHASSVNPPFDVSTSVFEDVVNACIDGGGLTIALITPAMA